MTFLCTAIVLAISVSGIALFGAVAYEEIKNYH